MFHVEHLTPFPHLYCVIPCFSTDLSTFSANTFNANTFIALSSLALRQYILFRA